MIRDVELFARFEEEFQRREVLSIEERFRVFKAMLDLAKSLKAWPPEDPLEGIEKDIRLAEVLREYGKLVEENSKRSG